MKRLWVLLVGCALFVAPVSASAFSFGNWGNSYNNHYEGHNNNSNHHGYWYFRKKHDNRPCNPVPEPSAIALFGAGALAVGWTVRRQVKK
jgi:hypothetical protein